MSKANQIPENLPYLQNLIKRDFDAYHAEVMFYFPMKQGCNKIILSSSLIFFLKRKEFVDVVELLLKDVFNIL